MIRELVSKVTSVITERRASARKRFQVPVKVWFEPDANLLFASPYRDLYISGETYDLSQTGIAFLVSSIRIKEDYLVGQDDRILNVELDLTGKKIRMQVIGRRYERIGIHSSTERYVIGAEIVKIDPEDRRSYEYFMRYGNKLTKTMAAAKAEI
jgi:hypothetical protein